MSLRLSILINILFITLLACSMGSPRPKIIRDEKDKLYRPCEDSEIPSITATDGSKVAGSSVGRLCSRTCVKKEKSKCKEWKTTIKNFGEEKDFLFFRNGSFVFIPEQYL